VNDDILDAEIIQQTDEAIRKHLNETFPALNRWVYFKDDGFHIQIEATINGVLSGFSFIVTIDTRLPINRRLDFVKYKIDEQIDRGFFELITKSVRNKLHQGEII
jgi:hypothetical protein